MKGLYQAKYGMKQLDLAKKLKCSRQTIVNARRAGRLGELIGNKGGRLSKEIYTSKYRREYGYTMRELATKYDCRMEQISLLADFGVLKIAIAAETVRKCTSREILTLQKFRVLANVIGNNPLRKET